MQGNAFEHFLDEGLIEQVLRPLKTGKEASVHLCRANPRTTGHELAALKVFHPLDRRDFRDEALYRDGEWIKERRDRVALAKKTKYGRELQGGLWVHREWETLGRLDGLSGGAPKPIAWTGDAILMTYIGDRETAAPRMQEYRAGPEELAGIWEQLLRSIERMLYCDVVHGDLSAFNVLIWEERAFVIDFPQAVDPKKNRHAQAFLERDIRRLGEYFEHHGLRRPWGKIANDLWTGWMFADLVPEELRGLPM